MLRKYFHINNYITKEEAREAAIKQRLEWEKMYDPDFSKYTLEYIFQRIKRKIIKEKNYDRNYFK